MTSLLALTGNNVLLSFESEQPTNIESIAVMGVDGTLLGVDTRPANGLVYGITDTDKIYTIDLDTGLATQISTLDIPFNATSVSGFDFNPVADRLRLVGDNEQDFRINVDTGAVTVDGNLAFAADDPNAGDDPSITAAAYTNSFAGTTSTTLYDIDQAQDILVLQDPPNDGVLKTIGELGIDFGGTGGFEIAYTEAGNNEAFAISNDMLYSINLGMGSATPLGMVDSKGSHFRGLTARAELSIDPIAQNAQFIALTDSDKLVSFDPSRPDKTTTLNIEGLDAPLLGIDTRPSNGLIYGITTANTVYTINPNTGDATKVSTLDVSFTGTTVSGFDFNPVADRLRLVGDNDQDFRINVETGAVTVDGDLAFAAGDVNEGANPKVTAAAYTNAIANPTTTKLYDIDTDLDTLVLQNPPNDGTLMTIGELGINVGDLAGFDIVSSGEGHNAAFAVEDSTLYSIDLETGLATRIGAIDTDAASMGGSVAIKGLATVDSSTIVDPIANDSTFLALSDDGKIASFAAGNPMAVTETTITGLGDGETLLGFDMRPANGMVYGITDADRIYTIDPSSGMATFVSQLDMPFNATTVSGFDFNPVADRLRLVGDNEQDFRINVDTGAVTVDGDLAYAADDANAGFNPKVTAAAYTNSIAAPTATQLYDIDTDLDALVLQNPPNDGTLMTIGELGVNFDELGGFDIVSPSQGSNAAFAVSNGMLYSIDLMTGKASSLGKVGDGSSNYSGLTAIGNAMAEPVDPIAQDSQFLALTSDDKLLSFDPSSPDKTMTKEIVGIDAPLLGIDTRPSNGIIYGITTANTIYTINPNTGIATKVAMLDVSFEGTTVSGFDFNPVADRLRLVGDNDQDFRINVDTGAVTVDGDLAFAEGDVNAGANPRVTAAAYTNAIASPTTTKLYDIDADLDTLVLQNPPNDGTLMTVGELGIEVDDLAGFDIVTSTEGNNAGFAIANSTLYGIDLETGAATQVGAIGSDAEVEIKGLATVDSATIVDPIANNSRFLALSDNNKIASFNPGNPKVVRSIDITGLGGGETLLGFDTRPANGLIYGITDADTIYTIDPNSGMAMMVSTLDMPFNATTISGFDFNPVADRLRLVGDNDQDFRINVDTGAVTVDGDLAYAIGDVNEGMNPTVTAAAYTNAVASPTATQLYDIDTDLDVLVLQNPPNDGTLMTIGELGVDFDTLGGFDIVSPEQGSNAGFAVSNGMLYSIDLLTGEASSLGKVGDADSTYLGLATVSNDVIEPTTVAVKADADGLVTAVAYDVTAANRVSADLGNNPAMASDAAFDNYVGFYEVSGLSGGIDTNGDGAVDLTPDDEGYAAAAIGRRLDNFVIRTGGSPDNDTTNDSFNPVVLTGGKFYAPFIIANLGDTTPEDFLTNNPNNSAATQFDDQVAYFSFVEANPDSAIHLKSLGSSTMGGSPVFGFEDLPGNLGVSDNDFNDAVFAVDFTVAVMTVMM